MSYLQSGYVHDLAVLIPREYGDDGWPSASHFFPRIKCLALRGIDEAVRLQPSRESAATGAGRAGDEITEE